MVSVIPILTWLFSVLAGDRLDHVGRMLDHLGVRQVTLSNGAAVERRRAVFAGSR